VSAKPEILKQDSAPANFLESVAAARQEVQMLYEMAIELGNSLEPPGTLSVLAMRLKQLVPFDTFAVYASQSDKLIPELVSGEDRALFCSLLLRCHLVRNCPAGWPKTEN